MNNFYDSIDKVDFTSIFEEDNNISLDDVKFCKNCFNEFSGEGDICPSCSKLNEEIPAETKLILDAVREFENQLPMFGYSDPTELSYEEQEELLTDTMNFVYGENNWSKKEFNDVARELGIPGIIKENVEEDISDLQSALSELKQGIEGLEKTDDVSDEDTFEFRGQKYTKEKAQKEIDKIEKDLDNLNQEKVDDLDNAFNDNTITEPVASEPVEEPATPEPVEVVDGVIDPTNGDAGQATDVDVIDGVDPLSDVELAAEEPKEEPKEDTEEDSKEDEGLTEAIQAHVTVDNIDQESKDKATIEKAIALAGDKNVIDNDTFRALRLALANKDYDLIDRLKDYALVRGEDVVYTWLRAEDSNLKESASSKKFCLVEGVDCGACKEEVLEEPEDDEVVEDGALQVDDVPAKVDQGKPGKRLELARLENEGVVSYRVSYLKEDDEIMGWDIEADSDEEALDALDKFDAASDTIDGVSNLEFNDTPIAGISSTSYNGVDLALSTAEDGNALLTITTQEGIPVLLKGENLDDILTKLIYWFIMGAESTCKEVM